MTVRIEFKPQDLWVGVYWRVSKGVVDYKEWTYRNYDVWVCLLPTLPIHISWGRGVR